MTHAKSLRVIGQSLEVARVATFKLEHDGRRYVVRSHSLTQTAEWILWNAVSESDFSKLAGRRSTVDRSVRFSEADILRLEVQRLRQRRNFSLSHMEASSKLSQLLRTVGDHLDRSTVRTFHISWTPDSITVDYQGIDGLTDRRTFTREKLQQFGLHTKIRLSSRSA